MSDPTHKELKRQWQTYEEYEQWLKENTFEKAKQKNKEELLRIQTGSAFDVGAYFDYVP